MALLPNKANSEGNNEGIGDRSPLPIGDYVVCVVKTEFKATKAKTGHYLSVHMKVQDGARKGSMLFLNLNLDNPNPIAVEIANKELNSICQAIGKQGVEDSEELHGIPLCVTVGIQPAKGDYPPSNNITGYKPADKAVNTTSAGGVATDPKPETGDTGKKKLPWK